MDDIILISIIVIELSIIIGMYLNELAFRDKSIINSVHRFSTENEVGWIQRNPLSSLKIFILSVFFIFTLYLGIQFYITHVSINQILMGNLSNEDRIIGEGMINLFSPVIGILFGIAFTIATLILGTFAEVKSNEKISDIDTQLKTINEKLDEIRNK